MPVKILIVEDEPAMQSLLGMHLNRAGYIPLPALSVSEARKIMLEQTPDLILLDWMLPDISGIDYLRYLRDTPHTSNLPVIMLTARAAELDKVHGLNIGADDYITKPFSSKELQARIKAVLRRREIATPGISEAIELAGIHLNPSTRHVHCQGTTIALGPIEFRLLHYLMQYPERVHSRNQLLDKIWDNQAEITDRTIDVHVHRLRMALERAHAADRIQTIRSVGYRFSTSVGQTHE